MTVIDRDDIMMFFDRDANFNHKFQQLIERHNLDVWGRTPERAEAMLADFRNWIYLQLLTMDTYEVDVEKPKYIVDKILSYTFYHVKCPKCGFYNETGKTYENCPKCGENFILMKEDNYEEPN